MTRWQLAVTYTFALVQVLLFLPARSEAQAASDVTVDDTQMSFIVGADAQKALESLDDLLMPSLVYLRADCTGIQNCFTSMAALAGTEELTQPYVPAHPSPETNGAWLWDVRKPHPTSPIVIDIGEGTWGPFICPGNTLGESFGGITLRGRGREHTILRGVNVGFLAADCDDLQVHDLSAKGGSYGVRWVNGGSANWYSVDMVADDVDIFYVAGWLDHCTSTAPPSVHYFYDSRSIALGGFEIAVGYWAACAETWFYGGEIIVDAAQRPGTGLHRLIGLAVNLSSDVRLFGTAVRVLAPNQINTTQMTGVQITGTDPIKRSQLHLHGSHMELAGASTAGVSFDVFGISARGESFVHSPGGSWSLDTPDGTPTRIASTGNALVQVPFQWESGTDEPVPGLVSETGADLFVETDCNDATGDCDGSGTVRPHLMVYDTTCNPTPWFDIATGACRKP